MQKCNYDGFMALYFREQRSALAGWQMKEINKGEQEIVNRRKKVTALLQLFIFHQNLPVLMQACQHVTEVEHPSVWQELVSEYVFSPKQSLNQLWRKHLFLPPFSLPCYSLYLLILTSSILKLPHCWCSGSTFPNINLIRTFSCFYISPCSFFSSSSFIPSSKAYWYKRCGFRPEKWWFLGHVSNTGQAFWKDSSWGGNLNVLRNDLWCLNCVRIRHCV